MIQVSNEFKKAIKESERRIKGYVEVLYDLPSVTITPSVNITSTYTPTSEISNGVRVENLYGSLDYLPLDGSYLTMGATNTNIGFISDALFENLSTPTITLSFSSTTIKGVTLYFRENTPTNLTLNYSDSTSDTITNNENNTIQVIFSSPKTLTSVSIVINDMMYQDRKIYLMEVDLGVTQVYKDQDLIEFTVDEEVNKLVEEVPINETNITLNNMSDLFNPLNPKGIVPYLSENTLIKPYIGVLTENLGVEYVKMGEFYFDSYTNNSDATTTLVGKNVIKQLANEELKDDNECWSGISFNEEKFNNLLQNYIYNVGQIDWPHGFISLPLNITNFLTFLKDLAFVQTNIFYAGRNNELILRNPITSVIDNITKNELLTDANYTKMQKTNSINLVIASMTNNNYESSLDYEFVLKKSPQVILIQSNNGEIRGNITYTGATNVETLWRSYYIGFFRVTGTPGSTVKITFVKSNCYSVKKVPRIISRETNEKLNEVVFDSSIYVEASAYTNHLNILDISPGYKMSFDYNGDPSFEAGDYINVETPYGYKPLFIQKNRFKFDGGLSGSIEGVE